MGLESLTHGSVFRELPINIVPSATYCSHELYACTFLRLIYDVIENGGGNIFTGEASCTFAAIPSYLTLTDCRMDLMDDSDGVVLVIL